MEEYRYNGHSRHACEQHARCTQHRTTSQEFPVTAYQMAVNNVARAIRAQRKSDVEAGDGINAFDASVYLAMAFCKFKEEVIADIVSAKV